MKSWHLIFVYAVAMAWVESAVVLYLRTMLDRIIPYQAHPLPIIGGLAQAELIREAATLIMLGAVGWLAGRTWRGRFAYFVLAFGIWDIAYYIWLVPLTGWPQSLSDWDILFLIPLPWWGPVWAPVSIALLLIIFGTLVSRYDTAARPVWPGRTSVLAAVAGIILALYTFMSDSLEVSTTAGIAQLRDMLPGPFNWPVFLVALMLMVIPVVDVFFAVRRRIAIAERGTQNAEQCQSLVTSAATKRRILKAPL